MTTDARIEALRQIERAAADLRESIEGDESGHRRPVKLWEGAIVPEVWIEHTPEEQVYRYRVAPSWGTGGMRLHDAKGRPILLLVPDYSGPPPRGA